jgi:hypothetical protein
MIFGFIFNGELFIYYLNGFQESFYRAGFAFTELEVWMKNDYIINDFIKSSSNNNVDFFVIEKNLISDNEMEIIVWGTVRAKDYIKDLGIEGKKYESMFSGNVRVIFHNIKEKEEIIKSEFFYIMSPENNINDIRGFKRELVNKYGGGFPQIYGSNREIMLNLSYVWGSIFILLLILTIYSLSLQKKENLIKIILGTNVGYIFFSNLLRDGAFLVVTYFSISKLLSTFSNVYFKSSFINIIFVIFITAVLLLNITVFNINLKKHLSNSSQSLKFLQINYILKIVLTVVAIALLTSNFVIIDNGANYNSQKSFFISHKGYNYYQLNYKDDFVKINNRLVDTAMIHQEFYTRFYEKSLQYIDMSLNLDSTYPITLINSNAKNELVKTNKDIENMMSKVEEGYMYLFIPESIEADKKEINAIKDVVFFYFDSVTDNELNEISYTEDISLVSIHTQLHQYSSKKYKNPIILLDTRTPTQNKDRQIERALYYAYNVMYCITDEEFNKFKKDYKLEQHIAKETDSLEEYKLNQKLISRLSRIVLVLTFFIILIEVVIIMLIIRMEYSINAVEITLKKLLGYGILERNGRIIGLITFGSVICIIVSTIINIILKLETAKYLLLGSALIFILELFYTLFRIRAIEKIKTANILKGEYV